MCAPSPPAAPDYVGAAQATAAGSVDAAKATGVLSNPNIISPLGNQTVTYGDTINGVQQPTITKTLTPEAQATLESQQKVQKALSDLGLYGVDTARNVMQQGFHPDIPALKTGIDQDLLNRQRNDIIARNQPQMDRQRQMLQTQLTNQGLVPGGEAYKNAMDDRARAENDFYLGADNSAYQQALSNASFGNTAIGQSLQQQLGLYNQPLNQISALMSGSQIQMPQFQNYGGIPQIQGPNLSQAAQQQGNWNTSTTSKSAVTTTLCRGCLMSPALR